MSSARLPWGIRSRTVGGLALFWIGAGIVCARYDLALSQALVRPEAGWAAFGQRYGELPGVYGIALAALAQHARPRPSRARWLVRQLPWLLSSTALAAALALSSYRLFGHPLGTLEAACTGTATLVGTRLWRRRLGHGLELPRGWSLACTWTLGLGISSWLAVSLLKLAWGRVRYRDLTPSAGDFSAWYAPQGWTGHASFPSGHAALGWLLLPSLLIWPRGSTGYRWAFALSLGWGSFVAASRVVIGAHYLSDVLFSSALAFGVMAFAPWRGREARTKCDANPAQRDLDGCAGVEDGK
jgi:membrane-associated phospholipid phosphatase